jgi:hypothetical protein
MSEDSLQDQLRDLQDQLRVLQDRASIIDVVCRFAVCIDRKWWDDFAACFADEVVFDTIRTGRPILLTTDQVLDMLCPAFESYTATQHISANHQLSVEGDSATVWSTLNATHYIEGFEGGEFQQQVGYYEYGLIRKDGWRINKVRMLPHWQTGNQRIFQRTVRE